MGFTANDPTGYGRIILSEDEKVKAIVEDKDASEEEQKICLVNGGVIAAKAGLLAHFLPQLTSTNTQNEQYLTDIVSLANDNGAQIDVLVTEENELAGVNDRAQLAHVEAIMQSRLRAEAMANGVTLQAPGA